MKRRTLFVCLALCVMTALWTVLPAKALEPEEELPVISSAPEESEESAVPEEPEENAVPEEDAVEPLPQAADATSGSCGENLTWVLESDGTLRISGTGAMDNFIDFTRAPWYNCRGQVKAVVIEGGVTSIGNNAFTHCTGLTSVEISSNVTSIGRSAFSYCTGLTSLSIPASVSKIGQDVFRDCTGLTSAGPIGGEYHIQFGWTDAIPASAFSGLNGLIRVVIPDGITSIGSFAFAECTNLTSLTIPASVSKMDYCIFEGCTDLTSAGPAGGEYHIQFGWTGTIPNKAFYGHNGLIRMVIPDGITSIGGDAFKNCTGLTSLTIPASVTKMETSIFSGCTGLTSAGPVGGEHHIQFGWTDTIPASAFSEHNGLTRVVIPDSITSIGEYAFQKCTALASVNTPTKITKIGSYTFSKCTSLTAFTIPGSVTRISDYTFKDCTSLTSVVISDGVTEIGSSVFDGCTSLTSLTVPASVTSINSLGFLSNTSLTSAGPIGGGYDYEFGWKQQIPDHAFDGCKSLLSATLPDGVTGIGRLAFSSCTSLTSLTVPASVTSIDSLAFHNCSALTSAGPIGGGYDYEFGWKQQIPGNAFRQCVSLLSATLPDGIASIGSSAFIGCAKLTSLTVPASVTSIASNAFSGCSGLTSAGPIGGGYAYEFGWTEQIPQYAFSECSGLIKVVFPEAIAGIGVYAFKNCSALSGLTVPSSVTSIGSYAFENCTAMTSLTVPASVTSIGLNAFNGCSGLTSAGPIGLGYSYSFGWTDSIPDYAFFNCKNLVRVRFPAGITSIGQKAFLNCSSLTDVSIPAGVTSIGLSAFSGCTSLSDVSIPTSVTSIGLSAFSGCTSLSDVSIPAGVTSIGEEAFSGCSSLTSVTIPASVNSIDTNAFRNCSKLTDIYYTGSEEQWNAIEKFSAGIPDAAAIHYNHSGGTGGTVTPEIPADAKRDVIFMGSVTWNEEDQSYTIGTANRSLGGGWKVTGETVLEGASSPDELLDRYILVEYILEPLPDNVVFDPYRPHKVLYARPVETQIIPKLSTEYTIRSQLYHTLDGEKVGSSPYLEAGTGILEEWNGRLAVIDGRDYYVCADTVASLPPAGTTVGFSKVKGTSVIVELSARKYDTETGTLTSYDRSKGTAVIGGQTYQVNTFEYEADLTDYVGKEVFFLLANGEIVHMDALERARYSLNIRMKNLDSSSSRITYEHGQFSRSSFRYLVTLSNKQNYQYPDRYQRFYNRDTVRNAVINAGLNQPIALYTASWDNCTGLQMSGIKFLGDTLQPDESIERETTAVIASGYRPTERSESIYTTLTVTGGYLETVRASQHLHITIENKDYKPPSKNPGTSTPDTVDAAHRAAAELDKIPTNALGLNMNTLKQLFEVDGTARGLLEKELLTAVVLSDLPKETLEVRVRDNVLKKIWKEYKSEVFVGHYVLRLPYRFQTKKYGQLSVTFNCEVTASGSSGSTYAKYISVNYEVSNPPSGFYPSSGILGGGVSVDLAEFRESVSSLVEEELKGAFDNAWGNSANEVADLLFGQTLQKIMKAGNTSVSQITWNLLTWPAKNMKANCPVNVFVYDADNVLQGSIENGVVTKASEDFTLAVEGEAKYITGLTNGYTVRYEATGSGYMNVTVEEQGGIGQPLRQISHYDVPLLKDRAYTQSVTAELQQPKEDYDLISQTGQRLQADEDLPLFNLELNYGLPDVSLYDWTTAGNRTTVTLLDHRNVLGDGGTVWAARYDGDGRLAELAQGTLANRTAEFDRPLSQDWWVFIWNGACQPLGPKLLLTSESRAS